MASKKSGMTSLDVAEAKSRFSEVVGRATLCEGVVIANDHKPMALETSKRPRKPGSAENQVWMSDDFDATPDGFKRCV
jgi:antitoxin (DNA-binding transcriptional repressor) of toxin-antitoxin stability system